MKISKALTLGMAGMMLATCGMAVAADKYPAKPIKLVVPYPPGGGIDPTARIFALALSEELGRPIVIQNTGGASGQIGTEQVARSLPDGYTLLFASAAPNAILPAAVPKLPYSNSDFAPIAMVGSADYVLVANASLPVDNIQQLLQVIKTDPDKIKTFASSGPLSGPHLAGELFNILSNGKMSHIPYRGNGPAVSAVLSGEVQMTFASAPAVIPHIKQGSLKAFGVSGKKRSTLLPDAPALAETMPGLEVSQWYGLMAPAGTPPEVISKIAAAAQKTLSTPKLREQLAMHGIEPMSMSPAEFQKFIDADTQKYKDLVQRAHISTE